MIKMGDEQMSEEKWTAGPWVYEPTKDNFPVDAEYDEYGSCGGSIMSGDAHIARIWADVSENKEEYIANAHLIKAALDMYDALVSASELLEEIAGCGIERLRVVAEQWAEARDMALKKARGEK